MFRRLLSLFAVLMLLCAGLLGGARGALATVSLAEQMNTRCAAMPVAVCLATEVRDRAATSESTQDAPQGEAEQASSVAELADVPPLPGLLPQPFSRGLQRAPWPAGQRPEASPYLDGPLRPPRSAA